ncbi:MAG: hypothetical protein KJZ83_12005, partial [Burkholderiaceae bacterium]|nr:hypothetical protein [Burkholderiaceae bacterium]
MKSRFAIVSVAIAAAMASVFATASAALVPSGGGDYAQIPLYRALSFGAVNFGNNGGAINGVDYVSNIAPLPLANGSTTIVANGATMTTTGASAYAGWYAGRNYAGISVTNANVNDLYYEVAGQGSATSVKFFSPDAAAAYATFTWNVTGTTSNPSDIQPGCTINYSDCFPTAAGRLDFGASTNPLVTWRHLFTDPDNLLDSITRFGPGTYTYSLPIVLGIPIDLYYWSSAFTQVDPGSINAPQGSNFTLSAQYFNTAALADVQLFQDAELTTPVTGPWTLYDTVG